MRTAKQSAWHRSTHTGDHRRTSARLRLGVLLVALAACQREGSPANASPGESAAAGTPAAAGVGTTGSDDTKTQVAFAYADRNADGQVSHEEFRNRMMRAFHHADADVSGHLDTTEYHGLGGPHAQGKSLDTTHVTPEAVQAELTALFERTDADRTGFLSLAEWRALPSRQRQ